MSMSLHPIYTVSAPSFRIVFLLLISLTIVSCESRDSARYIMDNYLYRLSNSVEVARVDSELPDLVPYPRRRELQYTIPAININLLEFLRLSECELQRHVANKNNALGRVMQDTQHLIYDAVFLQLANACLHQLADESALNVMLTNAVQHKQQYLPQVIWNATAASKEFSYLFSLGTQPLTLDETRKQPQQLIIALEKLNKGYQQLLVGQSAESFIDTLESQYQIIESAKYIGRIRLSLQQATHTLQQADQMLLYRIQERPLCYQQQANTQSAILNNVFHKYYIQQVQRYIAGLHQQASVLLPAFDQLLTTISGQTANKKELTVFWQSVYQSSDSEWHRFQQAIDQHTLHWQALLKQCGQLPK